MYVVHPSNTTRVLGKPQDWDDEAFGECVGLPVVDIECGNVTAMISLWQPTEDEIKLICAGEPIQLCVFGQSHPPVSVSVNNATYSEKLYQNSTEK